MKGRFLILSSIHLFKAFLISLMLIFLNISLSYLVLKFSDSKIINKQNFSSIDNEFVMVVFVAPMIETLIFQYLIINQVYVSYGGKKSKLLAILISSITFGLTHFYNLNYFLIGTICGVLLAYSFCDFKEKTNYLSAIFYVFLIHSLSSLYVFLIKILNLL